MLKQRREWFDSQLDLDPAKLVFIDETGLNTKMTRLRGRSLKGERCRAADPHGHWKTTTFTGALRLSGITAPMVLDGAMNGALVRGSANMRDLVFDGPAYLVAPADAWQRTEFGRPQASIRFRMVTPIAASVC